MLEQDASRQGCQPKQNLFPLPPQIEYALPLTKSSNGQVVDGQPCTQQVPHCDLCITPQGSDHPLCLACTPPYVADGRGKYRGAPQLWRAARFNSNRLHNWRVLADPPPSHLPQATASW